MLKSRDFKSPLILLFLINFNDKSSGFITYYTENYYIMVPL